MTRHNILLAGISLLLSSGAWSRDVVRDTTGFVTAYAPDATELLKGVVAGVRVSATDGNPLGAANVNIRGISSIHSDNQPLWIVNGVMLSTDITRNQDAFWQFDEQSYTSPLSGLAFLNAYDIESIEVLKDASATAIYGSKGANGVIIVKTKLARDRERSCNISSNVGLNLNGDGINHNHHIAFGAYKNQSGFNISGNFRNTTGPVARNSGNFGSLKADFETSANKYMWFKFNALVSMGQTDAPAGVNYIGKPSMTLAMRDAALSHGTGASIWASEYDDNTEAYRALLSAEARLNPTKWLYVTLYGGADFQHNTRTFWYGFNTPFGKASEWNEQGGAASDIFSRLFSYNAGGRIGTDFFLGKGIHNIKAELNADVAGFNNDYNTMNGYNFIVDLLRGKGLMTGAYAIRHHKYGTDYSSIGISSLASYKFKNIFGVNASVRYEMIPEFGNNENAVYPAADAFLDIHGIAMPDCTTVSGLRISAGFGKSGKTDSTPYNAFNKFIAGPWYEPEVAGTEIMHKGISRSRVSEWHTTLELGILENRINLAATYYDRKITDSFIMYRLGSATGEIETRALDAAEIWNWNCHEPVFERKNTITGRGLEFSADARIISNNEWTWTVGANLAVQENRMKTVDAADACGKVSGNGLYTNVFATDAPVACLYGFLTEGDGSLKDLTGEGNINNYDKENLGATIPSLFCGFQTALRYRNFSLEISLDGSFGQKIADVNAIVKDGLKDAEGHYYLTDGYVKDGGFLRLGRIGVKYNIPVKANWIKSLDVHVSCNNIATFTKYDGWNPDVNCFGNGILANGLDYGSYPVWRTMMIGVSAKF